MRPSPSVPSDPVEIVALLERMVAEGGGATSVPRALWNHALLDPLREFLARPSKGFRARLLELGFRLGGGTGEPPPRELPLLVEILHAGSLIIDDIEDDSAQRRGGVAMHRRHGMPVALNAGNYLYFCAQALVERARLDAGARLAAYERLAACLMRSHEGQALDLSVRVDELAQADVAAVVDAISRRKTGSLLGLAAALGAVAAGADEAALAAIDAFGCDVGVGLQMLDDLSGFVNPDRRTKAVEDLRLGRATWVWSVLAADLDAVTYQQLRVGLTDVRAGAPAEPLVERIRFRLAGVTLEGVQAHFDRARNALRAAIGGGAWCDEVHAELSSLQHQYLERQHGST